MTSCSRLDSRSSSSSWIGPPNAPFALGPFWKADSTKPASFGENTAYPSCTCLIDEIRSSPEIVFVTYPCAPARITEPTSCGESDTDSARKTVSGEYARDFVRISAPPPPSPPGTCTSSSTTSGLVCAIIATDPSTSAACPTTSKCGCNVAITPARNISWSSTTAILMRCSRSLIPAPWFD